ncbi:hypothetical protein EDD15DRAFT_2412655 [Pisolithus albus]|nr:hypothetical protein EDD15DRAFT_2412655 [Pisolithus albus]
MVPNPQLCCMFSVSLYDRYSSFAASLYPRIMGSTGSGRSNFIDKLAEPEGAKASRSAIQVFRAIADWLRRKDSSAELQEAIESMCSWYHRSSLTIAYLSNVSGTASLANSGRLEFQRSTSNTSVQVMAVSIVRHPCAWTMHDPDRVGLHGSGSMGPRIDYEPVTYPPSDRIIVSRDKLGIVRQLCGPDDSEAETHFTRAEAERTSALKEDHDGSLLDAYRRRTTRRELGALRDSEWREEMREGGLSWRGEESPPDHPGSRQPPTLKSFSHSSSGMDSSPALPPTSPTTSDAPYAAAAAHP